LRIRRDGGIPPSNPYTGTNSDRCNEAGRAASGNNCKETFARGFRNPFRMAFDPDAMNTSFRINDVGGKSWEETDRAQAGSDYGWNLCEGRHDNPYRGGEVNCSGTTYAGPIHEYSHSSGCESITGGVFVPDGFWPTSYDNSTPSGITSATRSSCLRPELATASDESCSQSGWEWADLSR
jgi:glucose/arabinose dehydrogenase